MNRNVEGHTPDGQPISWRQRRDTVDLFIGGWRVGTFKTEGGLRRAIARRKTLKVRGSGADT